MYTKIPVYSDCAVWTKDTEKAQSAEWVRAVGKYSWRREGYSAVGFGVVGIKLPCVYNSVEPENINPHKNCFYLISEIN